MTIFDGATDPLAALAALQSQLAGSGGAGGDNPGMAMLLQLLEQQKAAAAASPAPDDVQERDPSPTAEPPAGIDDAMRADLQALVDRSVAMDAELTTLRQRNDAIAAALGACHLCYGEDDWCRHCGGRGSPGSRRPDADAFDRYVRPVLTRLARRAAPTNQFPRRHAVAPDSMNGAMPGVAGMPRANVG